MQYPRRSQYKHAKKKYRIRNWRAYTEALRRRGDLTVWFDVAAIEEWQADKTGKPGWPSPKLCTSLNERIWVTGTAAVLEWGRRLL